MTFANSIGRGDGFAWVGWKEISVDGFWKWKRGGEGSVGLTPICQWLELSVVLMLISVNEKEPGDPAAWCSDAEQVWVMAELEHTSSLMQCSV